MNTAQANQPKQSSRFKRHTLLVVLIVLVLGTVGGVVYKGMRPLVIFSEIDGQLLKDGEPAAGVTLTRTWYWPWIYEDGSDTATTDADGRFKFPAVERRSFFARFLPHEPSIMQRINAQDGENVVEIWATTKHSYVPKGEFGRVQGPDSRLPISALCDISSEPARAGIYRYLDGSADPDGAVFGRCVFPGDAQ